MDGLIATMSIPGSVNTDVFLTYIQEVLLPQLWVGAVVIMDNLPVHHAQSIEDVIESVGAKVVFLPPYSPDLSPIELCWSKLKQCLRAAKARTHTALEQALTQIVTEQISSDDAWGWFNHCDLLYENCCMTLAAAYLLWLLPQPIYCQIRGLALKVKGAIQKGRIPQKQSSGTLNTTQAEKAPIT